MNANPSLRLDVTDGHHTARYDFETLPVRVGRARDNDLVIESRHASRHHLSLEPRGEALVLVLGAGAAIELDGTPVAEETRIAAGAVIRIGSIELEVLAPLAPTDPPRVAAPDPASSDPASSDPASSDPVGAAPRRAPALRWLVRHWPLAAALGVAAGLAFFMTRDRAGAQPDDGPRGVGLCDAEIVLGEVVPGCDSAVDCARQARAHLEDAERLAGSRRGDAVYGEALAAARRAMAAATLFEHAEPRVAGAAERLARQLTTELSTRCARLEWLHERAGADVGERRRVCDQMAALFTHGKDWRNRWAKSCPSPTE